MLFVCVANSLVAGDIVVSSLGRDADDATEIVQKALDSGAARVVLDLAGSPYVVRPLFVRSNTEVLFEEGVEVLAKKDEFHDKFDALITLNRATNVVLRGLGSGAILKMHKKDYQSPAYSRGEWRHAVNMLSVSDVTIENLTLADSGGDGIYVGAKPSSVPCRNVVIRRCVCDNNNRQGISVISVDGLLVERTTMKNTHGMPPMAGIDFEPNSASQKLKNIVMRDCLTEGNYGSGYELFVNAPDRRSEPIDILLDGCRSTGNRSDALKIAFSPVKRLERGYPGGGAFRIRNCAFVDSGSSAVRISNKPNGVMNVVIENSTIEHGSSASAQDVRLVNDDRNLPPTDGVDFRNVKIVRPKVENWFAVSPMPWASSGMDNVRGTVNVVAPDGTRKVVLDKAWRACAFPRGGEKYALAQVAFDPAKAVRVVDSRPGEAAALSPVVLRFAVDARVYVAKPGPVTLVSRFVRISPRMSVRESKFVVKDCAGNTVEEMPVPAGSAEPRTFHAPAAGFYTLRCGLSRHGIIFTSCDAPIGFLPVPVYGLDIYKSCGDVFFAHSAKTDITLFCGGTGEPATFALFDPGGLRRGEWKNQAFWGFKRIAPSDAEGLWRLAVSSASCSGWEDTCCDLTGAPSVFFLSNEKYWYSAK